MVGLNKKFKVEKKRKRLMHLHSDDNECKLCRGDTTEETTTLQLIFKPNIANRNKGEWMQDFLGFQMFKKEFQKKIN